MKQHNERLKTYQPSILQTMCAAADANEHAHSRARSAPTAHEQPLGSTWEARKRAQQAAREAQARSKAEAFKAAMQHKQAHDAEQHEHEFQVLYKDVLNGLMHGGGILTDVQEMLNHANAVRKSRQAELYKQWSTEVFDKIQDRIRQGMLQSSIKQLEASLQSTSADYLHATNSKLGVFRAVHIGSDYNPLQPLANSICIKTGDIVDPLKRDLLKAQAESALLASAAQPRYCNSASSSSAGSGSNRLARAIVRQTLETQRWAAGQINATPYGHCIDETGSYAVKPPSAQDLANKASHLYMDDFSRPPAPDVYRPGKHVAPHADKGTAFFDIMQARCKPGVSAGDSWLEHKGKRFVETPEVASGRKRFTEILQQTSNPYQDGRASDDLWLQPLGRRRLPVPGQHQGQDMGELLQHTSNPYVDGKTLGGALSGAEG